jgi:hypothetical protein
MRALLLPLLLLAACDDKPRFEDYRPKATVEQPQPALTDWQIGPWSMEMNYSHNMPLHPTLNSDGSFYFDFGPGQSVHYVTGPTGSLANSKQIRGRFKVEGDPDTGIHGKDCGAGPSGVTLFFSWPHQGSREETVNWSHDGQRWWATFAHHAPLKVNTEFEIVAPLDGPWTSVLRYTAKDNPDIFQRDLQKAGRVGFTFSNCTGYGHGATATKPVRFTVLEFVVE